MKKGESTSFILAVTFVLAATLLSAQMILNPTGLATQPQDVPELGQCYDYVHTTIPRATTYENCREAKPVAYKWVDRSEEEFYC